MTNYPKSDHTRASITLFYVIALNTKHKVKNTINRNEAAQVLADLLQINHRAPESWMRGDFKKHPISRENFLRFVRAYRTKPGLETPKDIATLAINLYGREYKKSIELLDQADRESDIAQDEMITLPGKSDVVTTINNLLKSSSPEAIETAFATMKMYQWSVNKSRQEKFVT